MEHNHCLLWVFDPLYGYCSIGLHIIQTIIVAFGSQITWLVVYLPLWKILVNWDDSSLGMEK